MNKVKQVFKVASLPVRWLAHGLHKLVPHNKRCSEVAISVALVLTGAWLASLHQELIPHVVWDATAWTIHGIGAAPIVGYVLSFFE